MWQILSALASPWPLDAGTTRIGLGWQRLDTERQFASPEAAGRVGPRCPEGVTSGSRSPYDCTTGGRFRNQTAALTADVGVTPWLTVESYLPLVLAASFTDDIGTTRAWGPGDLRFGVRMATTRGPFAIAGTLHGKAPTGPAGLVDRDVPLGDAQWDVLPGFRVGASLYPWGWVEMHHQLAIRLRSQRSGTDPGEEWTGNVGGGFTPVGWGGWLFRGEWILAARDTDAFGLPHPGRKLLQVRTGPFVRVDPMWVELSVAVPVAGQRWPTAPVVGAAVAVRWPAEKAL